MDCDKVNEEMRRYLKAKIKGFKTLSRQSKIYVRVLRKELKERKARNESLAEQLEAAVRERLKLRKLFTGIRNSLENSDVHLNPGEVNNDHEMMVNEFVVCELGPGSQSDPEVADLRSPSTSSP